MSLSSDTVVSTASSQCVKDKVVANMILREANRSIVGALMAELTKLPERARCIVQDLRPGET